MATANGNDGPKRNRLRGSLRQDTRLHPQGTAIIVIGADKCLYSRTDIDDGVPFGILADPDNQEYVITTENHVIKYDVKPPEDWKSDRRKKGTGATPVCLWLQGAHR